MMAAACRMELIKLRTLRSTWWLAALYAAVMIGLGILALTLLTPGILSPAGRASFDPTSRGFIGAFVGQIIAGIFGVLAFTGEYSSGMIRMTLAACGKRHYPFGAKVVVTGIAALACSEVISFATFLAGEAVLRSSLPHASLGQAGVARAVLTGGAYLFLVTLIGLGFGALFRNAAAAIGVFLGALFALPLVVSQLPHGAAVLNYLPGRLVVGMVAVKPAAGALSPWAGLLLMCLYAAAILAAAYWAFARRDA